MAKRNAAGQKSLIPKRKAGEVPPKFAKFGTRIRQLVGDASWEDSVKALVDYYKGAAAPTFDPMKDAQQATKRVVQLMVEATKDTKKRKAETTGDFAVQFDMLREVLDQLEVLKTTLTPHVAAVERIIIERLLDDDQTQCRLSNGVLLSVRDELVAKAPDRAALLDWVRTSGQDDLLTLNYQTMNSVVKAMHDEGQEIPQCIEVYYRQQLSRRRASNTSK